MKELKTLLVDLELSYAIGYFFPSKKPQFMSARQIKQHQFCVCAAWKWSHEVSVYDMSTLQNREFQDRRKEVLAEYSKPLIDAIKNFHIKTVFNILNKIIKKTDLLYSDKNIALKLHSLFTEADIIVAHNGDSFDLKHANTMFIKHGLTPIPERKSIDTLKVARKYFAFAGNSLSDILRYFKMGDKEEKPDWQLLTEGDEKEIKKAVEYCKVDVIGLEKVFVKLRPYIRNYPTTQHPKKAPEECAVCKCKVIESRGTSWRANNQFVHRYKCMGCGYEHKIPVSNKGV